MSGYTIQNLKKCLIDLAVYMRMNLDPDRLEGFYLDIDWYI